MLQELFLALSGHPSPLFGKDGKPSREEFPLLSPSEAALLQSLGKVAELHRKLRAHIEWVAARHRSIISRAVATSIQQEHLARFQRKILDVESQILCKDARIVGAYDIVPLASIVSEFDDWHRRMTWLWDIATFMQPPPSSGGEPKPSSGCNGAWLINELRSATNTGFPEIEEAAIELGKVAETAWLRQLASWLLYSRLPAHGTDDFFIKGENAPEGDEMIYRKDAHLLPSFVIAPTASSILFVGKSLNQVRRRPQTRNTSKPLLQRSAESDLIQAHSKYLTALTLPIVPAQLSRAVSAIRLSVSQNVLQHLLPMEDITRLLSCLRDFMLLGKGDFALALISEAEARVQARQQSMGRLLQQDAVRAMQGLSIKDGELQQALTQVWKSLAREDDEIEDSGLEFAMWKQRRRYHMLPSTTFCFPVLRQYG
ncbi:hypothetical protein KC355_g14964 [Hortaea werneckii]|nr:hypothetical protein KC355_g14964 [Hortaea werneckii]